MDAVWSWLVPTVVGLGLAALLLAGGVWALRRSRRSPKARQAAEAERTAAGVALVILDDAVAELDIEVELSGALYDGTAPDSLRRARMTAQHARDEAFEQYRALDDATHPDEIRRAATRIQTRADAARAVIARARADHAAWMDANVSATRQVAATRERAAALRVELGDPAALLAELEQRFDPREWAEAQRAAHEATRALDEADRQLRDAAERAGDPTRSALRPLSDAERQLRRAREAARAFENSARAVTDAARTVPDEIARAREALRQATALRGGLEPDAAARLGDEVREIEAALAQHETDAARLPSATAQAVMRLRDRLDQAVGDARTAQQRLHGARSALPGALRTADAVVLRAESAASHAGADARVRLASAQRELSTARDEADPVAALDAARRAMRHAEDAIALADYDRLGRR
ncbi:hypothetical protein [Microbacterium sp. No. 7]|uniref:hypothetical protein n=1 Tax=Microbacterium sp. No. 7 TaxID=1714373 RepID=UPI0006D0BF8E|nr:hypothetical protein [Microbacterium sp. No. 7]ALJ18489.1 hypothetical protein AOA12_00585 [Microbacterium sp. No. 7]